MRSWLRIFGNALRLCLGPIWLTRRWLARRYRPRWVVLRLQPRVSEFRARTTLLRRLLNRAPDMRASSIEELRELVLHMTRDANVKGLALYLTPFDAGWATCESLRDALVGLRDAGKQLVVYLPEGGGNRELYLALAADRIYAGPYTAFGPLGLAAQPLYLRPLLERIGVEVQVQACGEYKSAAEPALRDTLSAPAREQLEALLEALQRSLESALRERRGLSTEQIAALFERGLLRASEALAFSLIDGIIYPDELRARLEPGESSDHEVPALSPGAPAPALPAPGAAVLPAGLQEADATIAIVPLQESEQAEEARARHFTSVSRYLRTRTRPLMRPIRDERYLAVLPLRGTILGDHGGVSRSAIRHVQVAASLRALAEDDRAPAVVLFIDSPGGSALASELIHRDVKRLAAKKPVVACFGDVAASGGYYIASACRRIVAQPLTITGSIGVISAKLTAGRLLEQLGVRPQLVRTAPHADMTSFTRGFTSEEDDLMRAHANELYERFLAVVAEGRQRPVSEIEPLARGRVWSGRDAHERGLVDVLGGLPQALDQARALLGELSSEELAALKPRVYHARSRASAGTAEPAVNALLSAALEALPELDWLVGPSRERLHYYAPFVSGLAQS